MIVPTIIVALLSAVCALVGNHLGAALTAQGELMPGELSAGISRALEQGMGSLLRSPLELAGDDFAKMGSLLMFCVPWFVYLFYLTKTQAGDRKGEEQGSSVWGNRKELMAYADAGNPDPFNKLIFSRHYGLAISRKGFDMERDRNLNVAVIGGSGSGKTRYFVKPNVCQMFGNMIITDPKGTLMPSVGQMLVDHGYEVYNWDTNQTGRALVYNPFHYLVTDLDIVEWVQGFMQLTSDQQKSGGDPFWSDSVEMLFIAIIALLRDWFPKEDYTFEGLMTALSMAQVSEEDENFKSSLDKIFDEIETGMREVDLPAQKIDSASREVAEPGSPDAFMKPSLRVNNTTGAEPGKYRRRDGKLQRGLSPTEDYALGMYKKFKTAAGKTLKSILISTNVKLNAIATADVRAILSGQDEIHLERLADPDRKYVLFDTFNDRKPKTLGFLHGMLIWQAIDICCKRADELPSGKLPRPVEFILDEYKSLNLPKTIADMISVVRSRNVGITMCFQSKEQLYSMYDEHTANSILGCCDTVLYLGGSDMETCKMISDMIGQQTLRTRSMSTTHQGLTGGSWSSNEQISARALIDVSEVRRLKKKKCIVLINGADAGLDQKYLVEHHPNYAEIDPLECGSHPVVPTLRPPVYLKRSDDGKGEVFALQWPVVSHRARHEKAFDVLDYYERAGIRPPRPKTAGPPARAGDEGGGPS